MNRPKLLPLLAMLGALLVFAGCVSAPPGPGSTAVAAPAGGPGAGLRVAEKFYAPTGSEVLFGTWVNPAHRPPTFYPKVVSHPWGLVEYFQTIDSASYAWRGTSTIVEKWTDDQGSTWYREFYRCSLKGFYSGHSFALTRVSPDGQVLESIFGNLDWPGLSEMDPELNTTYVRFTRRE